MYVVSFYRNGCACFGCVSLSIGIVSFYIVNNLLLENDCGCLQCYSWFGSN